MVELLRKDIERQALLEAGEVRNQAAIARQQGITQARAIQILGLPRLAPAIQQHILPMPNVVGRPMITERALRPIAQLETAAEQKARFEELTQHG